MGVTACADKHSTAAGTAVRTPASATALQTQLVKVVKGVSPAIVQIQCGRSLGSGVVFDTRGDVVTNAHVLDGANRCTVLLAGGDTHTADVVGRASANDLAVVRLRDATPTPATFADSSKVQVGDFVMAMGNPLGLSSSVTQGIVSSLNRNIAESSSVQLSALIQTSAEINPGNSGGRSLANSPPSLALAYGWRSMPLSVTTWLRSSPTTRATTPSRNSGLPF